MIYQGIDALWEGELLIQTRRGGRVLLSDWPARFAGGGLLLAGPGFAAMPLAFVVRRAVSRIIQAAFISGALLFVSVLIWRTFR